MTVHHQHNRVLISHIEKYFSAQKWQSTHPHTCTHFTQQSICEVLIHTRVRMSPHRRLFLCIPPLQHTSQSHRSVVQIQGDPQEGCSLQQNRIKMRLVCVQIFSIVVSFATFIKLFFILMMQCQVDHFHEFRCTDPEWYCTDAWPIWTDPVSICTGFGKVRWWGMKLGYSILTQATIHLRSTAELSHESRLPRGGSVCIDLALETLHPNEVLFAYEVPFGKIVDARAYYTEFSCSVSILKLNVFFRKLLWMFGFPFFGLCVQHCVLIWNNSLHASCSPNLSSLD